MALVISDLLPDDLGVMLTVTGHGYLGNSYAEREHGSVMAFYFPRIIAVPGKGFWLGPNEGYSTEPQPDHDGFATIAYNLDREFEVRITEDGILNLEYQLESGDGKVCVDYVMTYWAVNPNMPAFSFGPYAWEATDPYYSPGPYAFREGYMTGATGAHSHAEGYMSYASGESSHAEGRQTVADSDYSHSEGVQTEATYGTAAHAEGTDTIAQGAGSHAEGDATHARGRASHSEGYGTDAFGNFSHSEGNGTEASGGSSHAEGCYTYATGKYSHAQNYSTVATSTSQTAIGKFNERDEVYEEHAGDGETTNFALSSSLSNVLAVKINGSTVATSNYRVAGGEVIFNSAPADGAIIVFTCAGEQYPFIIGNGSSESDRSNALTVDWKGNVDAAGDATLGGALDVDGNATLGGTLDAAGGATLGGNVTINDGAVDIKSTNLDRDGSNPSAATWSRMFRFLDKDGERVAIAGAVRETDGRSRLAFYVYNEPSGGGTEVNNGISIYVAKDGTKTYGIGNSAAFCSALHVGDRVTDEQSTNLSIANAAWKNVCSLSLAAGTWVIEANVQFASNAKGRRYIALSETSNAASAGVQRQTCMNGDAVNGATTFLHTGATKAYTEATTLYLVAYQNSGAALNVQGLMTAVRIR